jgi:hypothetical protein
MSTALVTIDEALEHLKWPDAATLGPGAVADLQSKLDTAHELVLAYVGQRLDEAADPWAVEVASWTPETAPRRVRAAILEMTATLDADRGDEPRSVGDLGELGELPRRIVMLLHRLRDPGIAV